MGATLLCVGLFTVVRGSDSDERMRQMQKVLDRLKSPEVRATTNPADFIKEIKGNDDEYNPWISEMEIKAEAATCLADVHTKYYECLVAENNNEEMCDHINKIGAEHAARIRAWMVKIGYISVKTESQIAQEYAAFLQRCAELRTEYKRTH